MLNVQFSGLCSYSRLFCLSVFINMVCTEFAPSVFYIKFFRMSQKPCLAMSLIAPWFHRQGLSGFN